MIEAEHFLRFAEALLAKPNKTEIDYRNAAARAYYAVYHLVVPALGLDPRDSGMTHSEVGRRLRETITITSLTYLKEAQRHWRELQDTRRLCDYDLPAEVVEGTAIARVHIARRIFTLRAA